MLAVLLVQGAGATVSLGLLTHLRKTHANVMHLTMRALLRATGGGRNIGMYGWAFSRGREHLKSLPESTADVGAESVWDGTRFMRRSIPSSPNPADRVPTVYIEKRASPLPMGPLSVGYVVSVAGPTPMTGWLDTIGTLDQVIELPINDGLIHLSVPSNLPNGSRVIDIDPTKDYMIVGDRDMGITRPTLRMRERPANTMAVDRARMVEHVWIPTAYSRRVAEFGRDVTQTVTVNDIGTDVSSADFRMPARTGDRVIDGDTTYMMLADGQLAQTMSTGRVDPPGGFPPPEAPPKSTSAQTSKVPYLVGIGGVIVIAIGLDVTLRRRRGIRKHEGYWGPDS